MTRLTAFICLQSSIDYLLDTRKHSSAGSETSEMIRMAAVVVSLNVLAFTAHLPPGAEDSISGIQLHNPASFRDVLGSIEPEYVELGFAYYRLVNHGSSEVITLVQNPGADKYSISEIRVNEAAGDEALTAFPGRLQHFVTGRGVHLGSTMEMVKSRVGKPMVEGKESLEYHLTADLAAEWLTTHNAPEYRAVYLFRRGRLVQLEFGFPYP